MACQSRSLSAAAGASSLPSFKKLAYVTLLASLACCANVQAFAPSTLFTTTSSASNLPTAFTRSYTTSPSSSQSQSTSSTLLASSTTQPLDTTSLQRAATESRGLAMSAITASKSGHLGLPLGCAELGATLYGSTMTYNVEDPKWINRDRFILSAGHGSMFVYSWLNIAGYDLPMEEIKKFRQLNSMTPGHPEFPNSHFHTPGIEATTGPLGAGVANAVGFAASEKMAAARFNSGSFKVFDHHVYALCGDGCLQEGVSHESAAFAAHEKLDNLIVLYDSNAVTLDKMGVWTQSEDVGMRYEAYGWEVIKVDGHDLKAVSEALERAKGSNNGKPKLVICTTTIGKGIHQLEGTNAAHGEGGVKFVDEARENMGLPADDKFYVSEETRAYFESVKEKNRVVYDEWQTGYKGWKGQNPELATTLENAVAKKTPSAAAMIESIPPMNSKSEASRISGQKAIQVIAKAIPTYVSGSADLHSSTKNYIDAGLDFGGSSANKSFAGRNIYFGIREHAMGAIMNGFAYDGIFTISGSTFLVFADYLRPTVRIAALAELPVSYIFTHDSIGVGEDGPTHQPVETVSGLRVIPNLDVVRPADAEETMAAYVASVDRKDGPTAIILSRQNLKQMDGLSVQARREGVLKGAYIVKKETGEKLEAIVMASGSEVQHCMDAFKDSDTVRVVSVPCMERFDRQTEAYKEEIMPSAVVKRFAMEAGATSPWYKYVGLKGKVIGTDRFGLSAPGDLVMKEFGMTAEHVKSVVGL